MNIMLLMFALPFIGLCIPISLVSAIVFYFASKEQGDRAAKLARISFLIFFGLIGFFVFGALFFFPVFTHTVVF